jgi:DNA-binding MarR family transcriptional regulator
MPKENIFEEFIKLKTSKKTSFTEQDYWFIFNNYPTRNITTKSIAERLKTSPRTIQRIIRDIEKFSGNTLKIQRTKTESNKLIVKNI